MQDKINPAIGFVGLQSVQRGVAEVMVRLNPSYYQPSDRLRGPSVLCDVINMATEFMLDAVRDASDSLRGPSVLRQNCMMEPVRELYDGTGARIV
jgi:hypothetical protein